MIYIVIWQALDTAIYLVTYKYIEGGRRKQY